MICGSHVYAGKTDRRAAYSNALGVDMIPGEGVDRVVNLEEDEALSLGQFDHVECWSVLEHSKQPWRIAQNLQKMLVHGGTIHVTVPFCWRIHAYPSDYFRFTPEGLKAIFPGIDWRHLMLSAERLRKNGRLPVFDKGADVKWLARTEVLGFGVLV